VRDRLRGLKANEQGDMVTRSVP